MYQWYQLASCHGERKGAAHNVSLLFVPWDLAFTLPASQNPFKFRECFCPHVRLPIATPRRLFFCRFNISLMRDPAWQCRIVWVFLSASCSNQGLFRAQFSSPYIQRSWQPTMRCAHHTLTFSKIPSCRAGVSPSSFSSWKWEFQKSHFLWVICRG